VFCTYVCDGKEVYLTLDAGRKCDDEVDFNDPRLDKPWHEDDYIMNTNIVGTWLVVDSNRPLGEDTNSNSIGTVCVFLETGVHYIKLPGGQRFKLNYIYDAQLGVLELHYIGGGMQCFSVIMPPEMPRAMVVTDSEKVFFDKYQLVSTTPEWHQLKGACENHERQTNYERPK
jgi:hypothetical protein